MSVEGSKTGSEVTQTMSSELQSTDASTSASTTADVATAGAGAGSAIAPTQPPSVAFSDDWRPQIPIPPHLQNIPPHMLPPYLQPQFMRPQPQPVTVTATPGTASTPGPSGTPGSEQRDPNLKGVVGLQNLGNTCYANSTIQLIRAVPELSAFCLQENLESHCPDKESKPAKVLLAYQDLIKTMWGAYKPAFVRPMGFLLSIRELVKGTVYEHFGMPMQNDSHEYLVYLLDNFHEALNTGVRAPYKELPDELPYLEMTDSTMQTLAHTAWNTFKAANSSPIVDMCFGMLRKTVECMGCHGKSYKWEHFNVLKIQCEGASLAEWIAAECKSEDLEGYHCVRCGDIRQNAKIHVHLWHMPHTLFMAIKRFQPDGRKNMVNCPYNGHDIMLKDFFAPECDDPSREWLYELRGVTDHHGFHNGGHYSMQFRHPISDQWWWVDDEMSHIMPGPRFGNSTYILLFTRKDETKRASTELFQKISASSNPST